MKPRVSILTPTFNHERFIRDCIDSVLSQSFTNWEQIIIDDGSTDATSQLIRQYQDDRIKFIRQQNQGAERLAETYNTALSHAAGDLIAILEGDDMWPQEKLTRMVPLFDDPEIIFAYGALKDTEVDGTESAGKSRINRLRKITPHDLLCNKPVGSLSRLILRAEATDVIAPATVIIRRSALLAIGGFKGLPGLPLTDYPTFLTLTLQGKFAYVPEIMGIRRRHLASITCNKREQILECIKDFAFHFVEANSSALQMNDKERRIIFSSWTKIQGRFHVAQGRLALARRNWPQARSEYRLAWCTGGVRDRALAAIGIILSLAKRDMEDIAQFVGRPSFRIR